MTARSSLTRVALVVAATTSLGGCTAGMVKSTDVVDGRTVTVWEDPATAARREQQKAARADYAALYREVPKRAPGAPVYVALHETVLSDNLAKSAEGRLFEALRGEFADDPVIRVVVLPARVRGTTGELTQTRDERDWSESGGADVVVRSSATLAQQAGIDRRTGKLGSMLALEYRAEISAPFLPEHRYTIEKSGSVLNHVAVTRAFADEIRALVRDRVAPDLPDRTALARATGLPVDLLALHDALTTRK